MNPNEKSDIPGWWSRFIDFEAVKQLVESGRPAVSRHSLRLIVPLLLISLPVLSCFGEVARVVEFEKVVETQKPRQAWRRIAGEAPLEVEDLVRTGEYSRAVVQLTGLYMLRLDELTKIKISKRLLGEKPELDFKQGAAFIFSRERDSEINIHTPSANAALRGTQLIVRVTPLGKTLVTVLEGKVNLSNALDSIGIDLNSGEQGEAEVGKRPRKTAAIEAKNILQWCLYYPGVLNPDELALGAGEQRSVAESLRAYRQGDLLGALEKYPLGHRPGTEGGKLYRAAVLLAVGRVDDAQAEMKGVGTTTSGRRALEQMIAAVNFEEWTRPDEPKTAGEWVAESYYRQSRSAFEKNALELALKAARQATDLAPEFGYAWVRVAELEFSFGHTRAALLALNQGLKLTPDNAQGHALRGFVLAANNSIGAAREDFERAIALDGALGNAWLGRGLTYIRQGQDALGRQDLQTAVTLEPNRSILFSYLGKAFSQVGDSTSARRDLTRAVELDPKDPTPWLYSGIEKKQGNRYNEAISDIERSLELNQNRRVYRSKFLLDQDRAVRGTNLASIYKNDGMVDQSVREAVQAVNSDYSSAPAHLFLSNSYDALRDPRRIQLRYETAWFNELLLSNLLSPVGGGPLSQFVSQQEYSKLFEHDGLGISSVTEYFSNGDFRETGSQYGTFGNLSYALDAEYLYQDGIRPNNSLSRFEAYATFKLQLGPQDTLFLKTKFQDLQNGDIFQRYNVRETNTVSNTFDFRELQEPALILLGWHHEWSPGNHTLVLAQRLANDQVLTADGAGFDVLTRDVTAGFPKNFDAAKVDPNNPLRNDSLRDVLDGLRGKGILGDYRPLGLALDLDYRANFEIYGGEVQQIVTLGQHTLVGGARFQSGYFETHNILDHLPPPLAAASGIFLDPPARQNFTVDFERVNLYLYDTWKIAPWLAVTGGITYDKLKYPENFRNPPISDRNRELEQVSPKVGFLFQPHPTLTLRGAYTRGISGVSFDESIRLEPTQVAGFNQAFRTLIPEDVIGEEGGSKFETFHLSLEQKLPTRTYWGVQYEVLEQDLDRTIGAFDFLFNRNDPTLRGVLPSSLRQQLDYREDSLTATINQLVGRDFAFGVRYRVTDVKLREATRGIIPHLPAGPARDRDLTMSSILHEVTLTAAYNHPSGFFARGEALWYNQENDSFPADPANHGRDPRPGDDFWQFNAITGWRFRQNTCEVSCGVLNLSGQDYQLEPLNSYFELPRDRTFFVRCKFSF